MNKNNKSEKESNLTVKQIGSPIGRRSDQKDALIGLGLNKIGRTRILPNNPSILGMIKKVRHLVTLIEN